jgi:hypothetical protein
MGSLDLKTKRVDGEVSTVARRIVAYSRFLSGHRRSYVDVVCCLFPNTMAVDRRGLLRHAIRKDPILFLMIEEDFLLYVGLGLLRRLVGFRTVGLLFRLRESVERHKIAHRVKNVLLRVVRATGASATLPILPVSVLPELEAVSTNWIHDFQFWDLPFARPASQADLRFIAAIREAAAGRKIVVALGRQDAAKGLPLFSQTFCTSRRLRNSHFFVAAGKIAPDCARPAEALEAAGAMVFDREISDADLLALYGVADVVWCLYAPTYDQASGIFGRSLQLGGTPLLRKGSLTHRFCEAEGLKHIAADYDVDAVAFALRLQTPNEDKRQRPIRMSLSWRNRTISVLRNALFGDPLG